MARILVVDDDDAIRELVAAILTDEAEHDVLLAANGQEALGQLGNEHVDVVVCDVNMPVMDGIELVRALRAAPETRDLPVLLISAAVPADALDPDLNVDVVLEKPFEVPALLACVHFALKRMRAGRGRVRVTRRRAIASVERMLRQSRRSGFGNAPAG